MNQDEVVKRLRDVIYTQYGTATSYANAKGVSKQHVSAVLNKKKLPSNAMLEELNLKKERRMVTQFVRL